MKTNKKIKIGKIILRVFAVIGTTLGIVVICLYALMYICTHGPSHVAKDLFVLSVRETSVGGFLANMVVSKEETAHGRRHVLPAFLTLLLRFEQA